MEGVPQGDRPGTRTHESPQVDLRVRWTTPEIMMQARPSPFASLLAVLLLMMGCATRQPAGVPGIAAALSPGARAEAIDALQGSDSAIFLREADIRAMATALERIRAEYPEVRGIGVGGDGSQLQVWLTDAAGTALGQRLAGAWDGDTVVTTTGLEAIDSVNALLHARTTRVARLLERLWILLPDFPQPIDVEQVSALYQPLPGVRSASPGLPRLGGGGAIWTERIGAGWRITFQRGWGDCPAGCINHRRYIFTFDPSSGRVTKVGEMGDRLPPDRPPNETLQLTGRHASEDAPGDASARRAHWLRSERHRPRR